MDRPAARIHRLAAIGMAGGLANDQVLWATSSNGFG